MIIGRKVDKEKKYTQILPAVWKAERRELEVNNMSTVEEVVERKLWAAEKVNIPAGSAKLVKVRTEGNWTGAEESKRGGEKSYFQKMPMIYQEVYKQCM